jgi:S1-C subfamily serine protease
MMEKSSRRIVSVTLIQFLPAAETRAQSIADIAERVGKSVTMIVAYDATGSVTGQWSGVFVNKNGLVLTNVHVLEDAYSAEVISDLGTFDRITIVFRDQTRDLALIQLKTDQASPITSGFTTLTPFVKARQNAYVCSMKSVRSMLFAARKIDLLIGGKNNGVNPLNVSHKYHNTRRRAC